MTESPSDDFRRAVLLAGLLTVAGIYASSFFDEARLWGVNWYHYYGWIGPLLMLAAGLAVTVFLLWRPIKPGPADSANVDSDHRFTLEVITGLPLAGLLFVLLRSRTFFLGDGYQVLSKLHDTPRLVKAWDTVTYGMQRLVYDLTGVPGEAGALIALWGISIGCGLLVLAAVGSASLYLFDRLGDRRLFTLGGLSGGYMLLFWGYIENYPPFVLATLVFALVGLLIVKGLLPRWTIVIPALAGLLLHPFAAAMIPAALYLLGYERPVVARWREWDIHKRYALGVSLGLGGALVFYFLYTGSYFFRFALVPLVPDRFTVEGYWLLSGKHLVDLGNLVVTLFPGVLLMALMLWRLRDRDVLARPEYRFLLWLFIPAFALVVLINPRLGMPRDWDLLGFVGIPLVLFFFLAALDGRHRAVLPREMAVMAIVLGGLLLVPRVVTQALPERAIEHMNYLCELDIARCRNGRYLLEQYYAREGRMEDRRRQALRNVASLAETQWIGQATDMAEKGDYAGAIDKFQQAIRRDPLNPYAWGRLGVVYTRLKHYDSALTCLDIADGINPMSFTTFMQTAAAAYGMADHRKAERFWKRALKLQPDDLEATTYLTGLYWRQGRTADFADSFHRVAEARGLSKGELARQLVDFELGNDNMQNAAFWLNRALAEGQDTVVVREAYPDLYRSLYEENDDGRPID